VGAVTPHRRRPRLDPDLLLFLLFAGLFMLLVVGYYLIFRWWG
jgi:hypothetical protein